MKQPFHYSILPRVSEAASAALGVGEFLDLDNLGLLVTGDDHLGNTLAIVDDKVLL